MASKFLNPETIKANAINSRVWGKCFDERHENCEVTEYYTAEQSYGGKAHRYSYTFHSAVADRISGQGAPYCGSRNRSTSAHGAFVSKVTCGRC